MLKSVFAGASFVIALSASASAEIVFNGATLILAATGCPNGPNKGDIYTSQYHPVVVAGATQSLNAASLNIYYNYGMFGFSLIGADFPVSAAGTFTTPSPITPYGVGWTQYTPTVGGNLVLIYRSPASLTSTIPSVTLRGKIQDPFFIAAEPNCVVYFEFSGVLTP